MKRILTMVLMLIIILTGCTAGGDWPSHVKGDGYEITRMEEVTVTEPSAMIQYLTHTQEEIIKGSKLIAKIEVLEEPVGYIVDFTGEGIGSDTVRMGMLGCKAKIEKLFYLEPSLQQLREGDTLRFFQAGGQVIDDGTIGISDCLVVMGKGNRYIVFLTDISTVKEEYLATCDRINIKPNNLYNALEGVCSYQLASASFSSVINCKSGEVYQFYTEFGSLSLDAKRSDSRIPYYILKDSDLEKKLQELVDQYK